MPGGGLPLPELSVRGGRLRVYEIPSLHPSTLSGARAVLGVSSAMLAVLVTTIVLGMLARLPICSFIAAIRVIGAGPASDRCALGPGGLPMPEPIRLRRERSHPRDPRPTPWLNSRTPQSRAEVPSLSDSPGTGRTRRACPRPVHPRARARTPGCRLGIPQTRTRSFQAEDSRTNWKGRPR